MSAYFITLEGIEGAGKSTVCTAIANWFEQQGINHLCTREPGGTPGSEAIRNVLLGSDVPLCPEAELLLMQAARAQLMREVILPALDNGQTVLLDRHCDSTLAYQGYGRGIPIEAIHPLNRFATEGRAPDLTLLLDIDVKTGLERSRKVSVTPDRFESETIDFMQRVRDGFLSLADEEPARFVVLDATLDLPTLRQQAIDAISARLQLPQ